MQRCIDTTVRLSSRDGLQPGQLTVIVGNVRLTRTMKDRLQVCRPSDVQLMIASNKRWIPVPGNWSADASPGEFVRRTPGPNMMAPRPPIGNPPTGMVIAVIQPHQLNNEETQLLVLWFQ